jgi:uncharacterized protein (TIGR00251 family)
MSATWVRYDAAAGVLTLSIYVQPNARTTEVAGLHGSDLKVRIAAPAVDNKANVALRTFIAQRLAVPPGSVSVRYGITSRRKVLEVRDASGDAQARARGLAGAPGCRPGPSAPG